MSSHLGPCGIVSDGTTWGIRGHDQEDGRHSGNAPSMLRPIYARRGLVGRQELVGRPRVGGSQRGGELVGHGKLVSDSAGGAHESGSICGVS